MSVRLVSLAASLVLLAGPTLAAHGAAAARAPQPGEGISLTGSFSPNGDGVKDTAQARFNLVRRSKVVIKVATAPPGLRHKVLARRSLGTLGRGEHTWAWDGRGRAGVVPDGRYWVHVEVTPLRSMGSYTLRRATTVDTVFDRADVDISAGQRWDLSRRAARTVYPRSTAVRDSLLLKFWSHAPRLRKARMVIKEARTGEVRARRSVRLRKTPTGAYEHTTRWTARQAGPLPAGRYRVFVRGKDKVGNSGQVAGPWLFVSKKKLVMREEVRQVTPQSTAADDCELSTNPGCGDGPPECGTVVDSALFATGLSYRSAECAEGKSGFPVASSMHYITVPEAVARGIDEAQVSFAGRPTTEGEADQGELLLRSEASPEESSTVLGSTGATTARVKAPELAHGTWAYEEIPPGVAWYFRTRGTDAVDVETFTVTVRYLEVA